MKYLNIFAILLGTVAMVSCQPHDPEPEVNGNPNGVVVTMAQTEFGFKENKRLVNIPFLVKGKHDGYVRVTCEMQEYGENPAMDDAHYYITSRTVIVAAGDSVGYFQFVPVDDNYINESREFLLKIVSVEGATIGEPNTTLVEIRDNDKEPYDRLSGEWYAHCLDWNGSPQVVPVYIEGYDDDEIGYNHQYLISGLAGEDLVSEARFKYDPATQVGNISIPYGRPIGEVKLASGNTTSVDMCYLTPSGGIGDSGSAVFTWNEDFTEIILESSPLGAWADFIGVYLDTDEMAYGLVGNPCMNVTKLVKYN